MQVFKTFFKKADIILVVSIAIICLILFLPNFFAKNSSPVAVVYKNGKEIQRIKLNSVLESYELDLDTQPSVILLVEKGRICYKSSECHDKLCVKCGWLTKAGDTAACLPSKTLIVIEGISDTNEPDIISY
ncbi:MAG: NusG domain II-containing protein [Clostridia bacterium]|nr:NusG domain II-containing protein [Clostridia bacterium]